MQQSGGLLIAAGWTAATPLFFCIAEKCKSSPVVSTNKKATFVYQTKVAFLSDVCLRQMMLFH
jgi:hypothetical protein